MWKAGLDESQAKIKIAGRNISNMRYAYDTTEMVKSEEERKSFFMKVKQESEKAGLKVNIQNTKIMASGSIASWQMKWSEVKAAQSFLTLWDPMDYRVHGIF